MTLDALLLAVAVVVMYASGRAVRCNARRLREVWRTPPLADMDLSEATVRPTRAPRRWPDIDTVDDPKAAAAYAALAEDRALNSAVLGEFLLVVGGAAIGTRLTALHDLGWDELLLVGAILLAVLGIVVRLLPAQKWEPVARRYRQRYAVLTQQPPSAPVRRRRWWQRGPTA